MSLPRLDDRVRTEADASRRTGDAGTRSCWFPEAGGFAETRILSRQDLAGGIAVAGPAIVEDPDCTAVVPPGDTVSLNDDGHLIIEIQQEDAA